MRAPAFLNEQRHLILLTFILLLFVVSPAVVSFHKGVLILNIIGGGVLVAAAYTLSDRKRYLFITAIILSVLSVILTCWLVYVPSRLAAVVSHCSIVLLVGFFVVAILRYVLQESRITADKIYAAICVYLLIGYGWSFAYTALDEIKPNGFATPVQLEPDDYVGRVAQFRYFSFITLTTMGYGDITPRSGGARTLAVLEAVVGQLYLVALVGRLIGLHIVHCDPRRDEAEP